MQLHPLVSFHKVLAKKDVLNLKEVLKLNRKFLLDLKLILDIKVVLDLKNALKLKHKVFLMGVQIFENQLILVKVTPYLTKLQLKLENKLLLQLKGCQLWHKLLQVEHRGAMVPQLWIQPASSTEDLRLHCFQFRRAWRRQKVLRDQRCRCGSTLHRLDRCITAVRAVAS